MDQIENVASSAVASPETIKPLELPLNDSEIIFFPPPPAQSPAPTDGCQTSPAAAIASFPNNADFSPVSTTFSDTEMLHGHGSPCDSDEKAGLTKLPSVQELETQSDQASGSSRQRHIRQFKLVRLALTFASPLSGLLALLFGVIHIAACFAILHTSDHAPVARWPYAPQVYLAILTAISNKALAFAVVQGTVVTWWLKAMRGTTLAQLHWDWAAGLHVWQAIGAGRHFSVLAFACLCATFVAIDGPLLQSASCTRPEVPRDPIPLSVSVAPEMPAYFSGWNEYPEADGTGATDTTNDFLPVLKAYSSGIPMRDFISGCEGTCTATIRAPALSLDGCDELIRDVNYTTPLTDGEMELLNETGMVGLNRTAFLIAGGARQSGLEDTREHLVLARSEKSYLGLLIYVQWRESNLR